MSQKTEKDAVAHYLWQRLSDYEKIFNSVESEVKGIRLQLKERKENNEKELREVKMLYFVFGIMAAIIGLYILSFL